VFVVLYVVVIVLSLLGNAMVILTVARNRHMRTVTNLTDSERRCPLSSSLPSSSDEDVDSMTRSVAAPGAISVQFRLDGTR